MDTSEKTTAQLSATELLEEQKALFARLHAEEEALMAPVRARIEEIRAEWREARDYYAEAIGESLQSITLADLSDPERAVLIYAAAYNDGWGVQQHREIYAKVFEDAYIFDSETLSYGYGTDEKLVYLAPRLSIPAQKDEAKLLRTAQMVEAVHRATMEIVGPDEDAQIRIFDDGLSYHQSYRIIFDRQDSQWVLRGSYGELKRAPELIDILRVTPTYN